MAEYIVEPKSRQDIRDLTLMLRKFLGLENEKYFPITELLDVLAEIFDNFSYEIVENNELPFGTHADTEYSVLRVPLIRDRIPSVAQSVPLTY